MSKTETALKLALEALENEDLACRYCDEPTPEHISKAINAIREALAQPGFTKHEVENADDWSEWVCPDPKSYLMKCCDCGLVHEAQFKVVRYKSDAEHEDCDPVDDPNVQAVFRMRRSEQWTPKDTAYRPGGLAQPEQTTPKWQGVQFDSALHDSQLMAQTEQEPVAVIRSVVHAGEGGVRVSWLRGFPQIGDRLYTTPPQRKKD